MSRVIHSVASIPYEIARDIEYAESRLESFVRWAFSDHNRATMSVINAVDALGRVWGKLAGTTGFTVSRGRPYPILLGPPFAYAAEPLPADPVVDKAVEVSAAFAEFRENPLVQGKGVSKEKLISELARRDRLRTLVGELGDLVRDLVQEDYVRLRPGDWVRVPFCQVVGRVSAVGHCRVRVTTAERLSNVDRIREHHLYTRWDLTRNTLEAISRPVPLPLCVPGLEWFQKVVEAQREFEFYANLSGSYLLKMHSHAEQFKTAVVLLFLSEYPTRIDISCTKGLSVFPDHLEVCFPETLVAKLRQYYDFAERLGRLSRTMDTPAPDQSAPVIQTLVELGRGMIGTLAFYIADQVGCEIGAQLEVEDDGIRFLGEDESETFDAELHYPWAKATLISQSGRTLTVQFDSDQELSGVEEVDITEIRA